MPPRIMLVDDNRDLVLALRRYLEQEGFEVIPAYDGPEALEKAPAEQPDAIVLDVYMPQMNGKEVLRRLKSDPATRHIPVIMQTAASEPEDFEDTTIGGADAHLPKPCDPPDLVLMLRGVLRAAEEERKARKLGGDAEGSSE
ncbi:MAG: PleD family two-component system response regulator [Armatimonadota bacterium]